MSAGAKKQPGLLVAAPKELNAGPSMARESQEADHREHATSPCM